MMFSFIIMIIPVCLGFKRGHNGYMIFAVLMLSWIAGYVLSQLTQTVVAHLAVFGLGWFVAMGYCVMGTGVSGDRLETPERTESINQIEAEVEIESDDFVVLATFTESWQQADLNRLIEALNEHEIVYRSTSGLLAAVLVRECDFAAAEQLLLSS